MRKKVQIKALRRQTTIKKNEQSIIEEEIIEISVFLDAQHPEEMEDSFCVRKTMLDENNNEYEVITEIIPFFSDKDYQEHIKNKK